VQNITPLRYAIEGLEDALRVIVALVFFGFMPL